VPVLSLSGQKLHYASEIHTHPGGAAIPTGFIGMWSGLLANIPSGWALCDGTQGTPDLRDRFVVGAAAGVDPGTTGGASTLSHTGTAVAAHVVTQPAAHVFTQPGGHSAHVMTQPSAHADNIAHVHTQRYFPTTTGGSIGSLADTSMSGTQTNTGLQTTSQGTGSSLTHTGTAVDAHSAHAGGAVDAHSGTAVDAHAVTQPDSHADSRPPFFALAFIMKL